MQLCDNNDDVQHYIYVSGASGQAELLCYITGATGNQTIITTAQNSHIINNQFRIDSFGKREILGTLVLPAMHWWEIYGILHSSLITRA